LKITDEYQRCYDEMTTFEEIMSLMSTRRIAG
jgi:hypothetical protein